MPVAKERKGKERREKVKNDRKGETENGTTRRHDSILIPQRGSAMCQCKLEQICKTLGLSL